MTENRVSSFSFRCDIHRKKDRRLIFFPQRNSILETLYPFHLAEAFLGVKGIDPLEYIAGKGQMFSS